MSATGCTEPIALAYAAGYFALGHGVDHVMGKAAADGQDRKNTIPPSVGRVPVPAGNRLVCARSLVELEEAVCVP